MLENQNQASSQAGLSRDKDDMNGFESTESEGITILSAQMATKNVVLTRSQGQNLTAKARRF